MPGSMDHDITLNTSLSRKREKRSTTSGQTVTTTSRHPTGFPTYQKTSGPKNDFIQWLPTEIGVSTSKRPSFQDRC